MTRPIIKIEIGFASTPATPLASTAWTDVSAYLRDDAPLSIRRGRNDELSQNQPGTATFTLDNRDRRFDPENTSGPYGTNVKPMRRVRISGTWNGADYVIYTGYVASFQPSDINGQDARVTVSCVDALGAAFGRTFLEAGTSYVSALSSQQIGSLLDAIGWPSAERALFNGLSTMQAFTTDGSTSIIDYIQRITQSENGFFFVARDGKATFYDRQWRLRSTAINSYADAANYVGTGFQYPYEQLRLEYGDRYIYTEVRATRAGGATVNARDTTAEQLYFRRTLTRGGLLITSDNELEDAANWLLSTYSSPSTRVNSITLNGELFTGMWPALMDTDLQSVCIVQRSPPGGGSVIARSVWVEAINWDISRSGMRAEWKLSPDETGTYWVLGDSVKGVLGSTTRLAY